MDKCRYKNLNELIKELGMQNAPECWYSNWEHAMAAFPGDDIGFLQDGYIREANRVLNLTDEKLEVFFETLVVIRKSTALYHLAWLWYHIVFFDSPAPYRIDISKWPVPNNAMGLLSDMLHAVVVVAGLPILRQYYEARHIPYDVFVNTLSDVETCMQEYYTEYGVYGIGRFRMGWLLFHFTGKLYRLGRLQFVYKEFDECIKYFHNIRSGEITALCETGIEFRSDGKVNGTNDVFDDRDTWKSQYSEDNDFFYGNPVSWCGHPLKEPVKLMKNEWQLILTKGDGLLDVHIPRGEALSYDACQESYVDAANFFTRYFLDESYKGFTCSSWLLCPDLRLLLAEDSNIIKFQKDFYIYPGSGDESVFEYVFGSKPEDLARLPEQTSLQRAIKNYLLQGHHINSAGGVILNLKGVIL